MLIPVLNFRNQQEPDKPTAFLSTKFFRRCSVEPQRLSCTFFDLGGGVCDRQTKRGGQNDYANR